MPSLGEIKRERELGHKGYTKVIWATCIECGKERWVRLIKGKPKSKMCKECRDDKMPHFYGERSASWKGGRPKNSLGYVLIHMSPEDFFYPMAQKTGYVLEHRLVMARYLCRCLLPWEIVHHKGTKYSLESKENKGDNRIENLELIKGKGSHNNRFEQELRRQAKEIGILRERVTLLEAENILLRSNNKLMGMIKAVGE